MLADKMKQMIQEGLTQPEAEPSFFNYPTGYDLSVPTTSYNATVRGDDLLGKLQEPHAELEPSTR